MVRNLLLPLSLGFRLGIEVRRAAYRRGWFKTRRLNRPVVSIGNLTVGGTGKTPLVAYLAERLLKRGWKPSVLTRGYGRRRGNDILLLEAGSQRAIAARDVGDEAALLARALPEVPIVISADRYRGGLAAEQRFKVDVHLLDDGFQHWALARAVDVVALDVTQELSDWALLPAGPLREPCSALRRADSAVLTRVELGDPTPLEKCVRSINPKALIFHSTTKLRNLFDVSAGRSHPVEDLVGKLVYAFCGTGNPQAFFADLRKWAFSVVAEKKFRDHHVYSRNELQHLGAQARKVGASTLLTTEKDVMNFPPDWTSVVPIEVCIIRFEIQEAQAFEEFLVARLETARVKA